MAGSDDFVGASISSTGDTLIVTPDTDWNFSFDVHLFDSGASDMSILDLTVNFNDPTRYPAFTGCIVY